MYLHSIGEPEASFTKDDMTGGRHVDYEKGLVEGFLKGERERTYAMNLKKKLKKVYLKNFKSAVSIVTGNKSPGNRLGT